MTSGTTEIQSKTRRGASGFSSRARRIHRTRKSTRGSWTSTHFVGGQEGARYYSWPSQGTYRADKHPSIRKRSSQPNLPNTPRSARSKGHPKHDHTKCSHSRYANTLNSYSFRDPHRLFAQRYTSIHIILQNQRGINTRLPGIFQDTEMRKPSGRCAVQRVFDEFITEGLEGVYEVWGIGGCLGIWRSRPVKFAAAWRPRMHQEGATERTSIFSNCGLLLAHSPFSSCWNLNIHSIRRRRW